MRKTAAFVIGVMALFANLAWAETTLKLGSKAPELKPETWVQGEFKGFKTGEVYVVEFWGTWCPPCKETLPHMVELSREYAGRVKFVGVSALDDTLEDIKEFLKTFEPKVDYPISLDTTIATWETWLTASGAPGIPYVIVVDRDGTISFIGYPTELDSKELGNPIDQIAAGTWRESEAYKKYAAKFTADRELEGNINQVYEDHRAAEKDEKHEEALAAIERGIALGKTDNLNDFLLVKAGLLINHLGRVAEGHAMIPSLVKENWNHVQGLGAVLKLDPDKTRAQRSALQVLNLVDLNPRKELRERFKEHRWLLYPPVSEFYSRNGLPALAVYYQKMAIATIEGQDRKEDEEKLKVDLARYEKELSGCKDGVCPMPLPDIAKDPLDILLEHNPLTKEEYYKIFDKGGNLPKIEVLAAPKEIVVAENPHAEAAFMAVASNPLAHVELRKLTIDGLNVLKSQSAVPLLNDILEKAEIERHKDMNRYERYNEILAEHAARALGNIGDRSVVPMLLKMALDEKRGRHDRVAAIEALGDLKDNQVIEPLLKLFESEIEKRDPNLHLVGTLAVAFGKIGDGRALVPLRDAINKSRDHGLAAAFGRAAAEIGIKYVEKCEVLMGATKVFKRPLEIPTRGS